MTGPRLAPGQVWFVDFEPVRGREQGRDRPALIVSSTFHLDVTLGGLVTVLPLTSVERTGWLHRVPVAAGAGGGSSPSRSERCPRLDYAATHPKSR